LPLQTIVFLSFLDLILGGVFIAIGLIVLLDWQITDIVAWLPFVVVGGLLVFTTFLRSAARPQPCTRRRLRGGSPHACARWQRVRRLRREMLHLLHQGVGAARAAHLPAGVRCVRARLRRPPCRRAPALPAAGEHQRTLTLMPASQRWRSRSCSIGARSRKFSTRRSAEWTTPAA